MAIDAERDFGELADPMRLLPQGVPRAAVENRAVEGEVHRGHDLARKALRQIVSIALFAVHDLNVVHGRDAEIAGVQKRPGLAVEGAVDRVAGRAGGDEGKAGQGQWDAKCLFKCHRLNPSHNRRSR